MSDAGRGVLVRSVVILVSVLQVGCGADPTARTIGTVSLSDSAGVRMVTTSGRWEAAAPWRVTAEPIFRHGWAPGDVQLQQVGYGFIDDDGALVVADQGAQSVYVFDPDGRSLATLGAPGEGPGEFASLGTITPLGGDTILAGDTGNARLTTLTRDGYAGDVRFESYFANAFYEPMARLSDGATFFLPTSLRLGGDPTGENGWWDYPVLTTRDFQSVDTISTLPFFQTGEGGDMNPVRHAAVLDFGGDAIVHATSDRAQVTWRSPNGDVLQIARWDAVGRRVDDDDWAAYERGARARNDPDSDQERFEQRLRDRRRDFSGRLPLFWSGIADQEGNVWLADYDISLGFDSRYSVTYTVIGRDGELLGRVDFPMAIYLLDASHDRVLGIERDDYDVQAATLYAVDKLGG
jgi:6-bladed beta-propeller